MLPSINSGQALRNEVEGQFDLKRCPSTSLHKNQERAVPLRTNMEINVK